MHLDVEEKTKLYYLKKEPSETENTKIALGPKPLAPVKGP